MERGNKISRTPRHPLSTDSTLFFDALVRRKLNTINTNFTWYMTHVVINSVQNGSVFTEGTTVTPQRNVPTVTCQSNYVCN